MTTNRTVGLLPEEPSDCYKFPRSVPYAESWPSGFISVHIFREHKKSARLCKSNCKIIEVPIFYPASPTSSISHTSDIVDEEYSLNEESVSKEEETPDLSEMHGNLSPTMTSRATTPFPFLNLPYELRRKIYTLLLPPRHHKIVTQLPYNGVFYDKTTIPTYSTQSFYPASSSAPSKLTTYKILSSNTHVSFPSPSIHTSILRVSKRILREGEEVLYGHHGTVWDFGMHLEACRAFWKDRSIWARRCVMKLRIALELPSDEEIRGVDQRWEEFCMFLGKEMSGLKTLELTVSTSGENTAVIPVGNISAAFSEMNEAGSDSRTEEWDGKERKEMDMKWRDWEWIHDLMKLEALRIANISWWCFGNEENHGVFDSWLAGRMVGHRLLREGMVRDGVVIEGMVVSEGKGADF